MDKVRIWLLFIILIGFTLRLTLLGEQSLWYDEGVTWFLSQMNSLSDLIQWTAADIQPPLYYLLMWYTTTIFGSSEWALRFPSAILNTLTIPLLYILARRLFINSPFRPVLAPILAAILLAISPFMIFYSQEARMYTLLVFEAVLASYLLLKIIHVPLSGQNTLRPYLPYFYVLVAAAALYTHYFALFLLLAHALYILLILRQHHWPKTIIAASLKMFGLTALLFTPWLPILFSRLGDDPSYWPGTIKLPEAGRKILISFTMGETVLEQEGFRLALGYLLIIIISSLWLLITSQGKKTAGDQPDHRPTPNSLTGSQKQPFPSFSFHTLAALVFLLLWLCLPIILILVLSYQSPKFNARYAILAWPAFALLVSAILANLLNKYKPDLNRPLSRFSLLLFTLAWLFIFSTSAFSLYNWFSDPRFAKDDFKALAQFVRERIKDDETVLLSSGHMFPVWAYYYGWENWTALPQIQRLNVNRVIDLNIAADIAEAITNQRGLWLVTWQDEVADPNGVIPFWLDRIGQRPDDAGDFWGIGLKHWRLDPAKFELLHQNPIQQPANVNFANQVDLLGMTQLNDTELILFWRPRQTLPDEMILTLNLTDHDGFGWDRKMLTGRPGAYLYPPSRWPVGQMVMTRHPLLWQTGTPPGLYLAEVGLGHIDQPNSSAPEFMAWDILDEQGRPQRRTALLEFVNLSHLVQPDIGPLPFDKDPVADLYPIVMVRRSILPQKTAEPGDRILLALLWQAGPFNLDDVSVAFDLIDANNQTFRVGSALTPSRNFNLPRWQPGDMVLGQYWLNIPAAAAPGRATLQLHIVNTIAYPYDEIFPIDRLEILPTARNFTPPPLVDMPFEANFSDQVTLLGADCSTWTETDCRAIPGQTITLTLYWQTETPMAKNYTVFTHLLDTAETVLLNADHAPPKPTQGWVPGEIVADTITLTIPANLSPGSYHLEIGLYDATDPAFSRLPLTSGKTRLLLPQPLRIK